MLKWLQKFFGKKPNIVDASVDGVGVGEAVGASIWPAEPGIEHDLAYALDVITRIDALLDSKPNMTEREKKDFWSYFLKYKRNRIECVRKLAKFIKLQENADYVRCK